jgi:gliding motility-associated-like protein
MFPKLSLLLLLFTFISYKALPANFIVNSNADSGPGTLREALTLAAANGSAEKDYINFNLPNLSEAGRTIMLVSQLPDVSSNLIIDGSTQPGTAFGVSTTKVLLFFQVSDSQKLIGLRVIGQRDVEIYGLYLKTNPVVADAATTMFSYWRGIQLSRDINIRIGAAGKGNVFFGFSQSIVVNEPEDTPRYFDNLYLMGNFFGIDADGKTLSNNKAESTGIFFVTEQVIIGGTEAEGNMFAQGLMIYQQNNNDYTEPDAHYISAEAYILIKNNKFGVDYAVENALPNSNGLSVWSINPGGKNTTNIEDNVIATSSHYAIDIQNSGRKVTILRNYIGTDKLRGKKFSIAGSGILVYGATDVAIGDNNPANANYITNCNPVWVFPYSNTRVNKNSFYCVKNVVPLHFDTFGTFPYPVVEMRSISATGIIGTATPNSVIELFYSDNCNTCAPQTYFGSSTADNNGNWVYNGLITGSVIASATLGLNTSNFTTTTISTTNSKIINACDGKGSILGTVVTNSASLKWLNEQGNVVGTDADLIDVKPGKYKLIAANGDCNASADFEIKESLQIITTGQKITNASCNKKDGSITGISIVNNNFTDVTLSWKDRNGIEWGKNAEMINIPAGQYILTVTSPDNNCVQKYGPLEVTNSSGPAIDQTKQIITQTNCGQSTGSVKGIIASGTGKIIYSWKNEQDKEVSKQLDLIGQPGGKYTLQITDDTQCGPVFSTIIEIPEINGIILNESNAAKTNALCGESNGAITGITATGGTIYRWTDANNNTVGNTLNLTNQPAGNYTLTVINGFGCSKTSAIYHIDQPVSTVYPNYLVDIQPACFSVTNGAIKIFFDGLPIAYRWVNAAGNVVSTNAQLTNMGAGSYHLYLTDKNGCESLYNSTPFVITEYPEFTIAAYSQVTNATCGLSNGSITATAITGGTAPYSYKWHLLGSNQQIAATPAVNNLPAGTYVVNIMDQGCGIVDIIYTIYDEDKTITAPIADNIDLCSSGKAVILIKDILPNSIYRLYDTETSSQALDEQASGKFNVSISNNRSYYVTRLNGTCESTRTEVKVNIGITSADIANTITPNGDGINDYWTIKNINNYPDALVQVFNRGGQLVYQSKGYSIPFNGTYNSAGLPPGTYYYVINLSSKCSLLSGNLTILR